MSSPSTRPSGSQLLEEISDLLVGLGMITMILFPFALPFIALKLVAGPVLLVKRMRAGRRDEVAVPPQPSRAEASARGATSLRSPARQSNPSKTALGHG
jgi:hypothetical protein